MTQAGHEEDLRELCDPLLPHVDGIVAVVHRPCDADPGLAYLESVKGGGQIIVRDWVQRHHISQSETLYAGVIQEDDIFIISDTLERPNPQFISRLRGDLKEYMWAIGVGQILYFGKSYIVRYEETMHYVGSPHWSLAGCSRSAVEFSGAFPDESKIRLNVRPLKRKDEYSWIIHYCKYWLYPAGSNHALLGLDHFPPGDRNQQFAIREQRRLAFRRLMRERGFPLTVDGLEAMLREPLDPTVKEHLIAEKILSDYYWFLQGRGAELKHSHVPSEALPIE